VFTSVPVASSTSAGTFFLARTEEGIMHLRAPNLGIFILAVILAVLGLVEYLRVPLPIPAISLSIPGFPFLQLSTSDVFGFLTANAFWIVFLGWALLAIGTVQRQRRPSFVEAHLGEVISEAGPA